jgi:hypothetical protein
MNDISLTDLLNKKPLVSVTLMEKVEDYFQDEEHKREYEEWYERKYGKQNSRR